MQRVIQPLLAALAFLAVSVSAQVAPPASKSTAPNSAPRMDEKTAAPKSTATDASRETALLAGGCFWGMEEVLRKIPGVIDTKVGYIGGTVPNPSYKLICTGITGHAEAVKIIFDPTKITYEAVLGYFFRMHDATTLNRQHNDVGTQYRSAIFYTTDAQKLTAEQVKERVNKSGRFKKPVVTEITKAGEFWPGEDYHQKYLIKNPNGYNCHILQD